MVILLELWGAIFERFGMKWIMPNSIFEPFSMMVASSWYGSSEDFYEIFLSFACSWRIWSERNSRIFKGNSREAIEVADSVFLDSF